MTSNNLVMSPVTSDTTISSFPEAVLSWIGRRFAEERGAAKKLARLASCADHQVSPHTARVWLRGRAEPCWRSVEIMAARCDDLAAELEARRRRLQDLLR